MASGVDEIFSTGISNEGDFVELVNASASTTTTADATITATPDATAPAITTVATASVSFSTSDGIQEFSHFLNRSPEFSYNETSSTSHSHPSPSELSDHFLNELFTEDSQTRTLSPGQLSASPSSSSDTMALSSSSPRKRTNNFNCESPETISKKRKRQSSDGESASGGSKPNKNKKDNDRLIAEQDLKMQHLKNEISNTWTMIRNQDVWLACLMGLEYDSVMFNFSEFVVSHQIYRKIMNGEKDVDCRASDLEAFRENRQNKDKRKEIQKFQQDIIKGQEELLRLMKSLDQDLKTKIKTG